MLVGAGRTGAGLEATVAYKTPIKECALEKLKVNAIHYILTLLKKVLYCIADGICDLLIEDFCSHCIEQTLKFIIHIKSHFQCVHNVKTNLVSIQHSPLV